MTKQVTLKELVLGAVEGFLSTDSSFSVHNLTQSIRNVVNSGAVEIPALLVDGQAFKYEISHDDVKFYFNDLFLNNSFTQPLSRSWQGGYFLYYGDMTPAQVNPIKATSNALNRLGGSLSVLGNSGTIKVPSAAALVSQQAAASNKLPRTEVINRVRTYQTNCGFRGVSPTPKQIQSAIKRGSKSTGWTRSELQGIWQDLTNGTI